MTSRAWLAVLAGAVAAGCGRSEPAGLITASGHVEATQVRIAAKTPGTLATLRVDEGDRVAAGQALAEVDTVDVRLRTLWFGRTSFALGYEAHSRKQGAVAARGETVLLGYDYAAKQSVPLPAPFREAIERVEGRAIPGKPK